MTLADKIQLILKQNPHGLMTYVLAANIRADFKDHVETAAIRRECERLERSGIVERRDTVYARQIRWGLAA